MCPALSATRGTFAPSPFFTLIALALAALFVRLGFWQWHRGVERQAQGERFARGADQLLDVGERALSEVPLFQRVRVSGTLDGAHQFLLDNRSWRGSAGYEVLTPLKRPAARTLLVDRGWVPFTGSRRTLPDITLTGGTALTLTGRAANLPSAGLSAGRAAPGASDPWPKVTSFPDSAQLAGALGEPLEARILLLDAQAPFGYARDWQPPGISPLRNFAYAIQYWCFAALTLIVWAVMSRRRKA